MIDIKDNSLAGAVDLPGKKLNFSFYHWKMRILLNGCKPDTYINSGVLLMNLSRIRERGNLFRIGMGWILRRGRMAVAPDQDALNAIFRDDIKIINSRFNQNVLKQDMSDCIMHTLGGKAWRSISGLYSDHVYWKMYLRSAWGENTTRDELADILIDLAKPKKPKPFLKRFKKTFLDIMPIPLRAVKFIVWDIYYRLRYSFRAMTRK